MLALEHLTGGMLLDRLKKGPLAEHHAAAAFHQILTCILYMHHSGYLHRDLKPDNVMLAYDWDPERDAHVPPPVKLIDLGMVLNYVEQPNETGLMGSPGYMSPEAIRCGPPKQTGLPLLRLDVCVLCAVCCRDRQALPARECGMCAVHALASFAVGSRSLRRGSGCRASTAALHCCASAVLGGARHFSCMSLALAVQVGWSHGEKPLLGAWFAWMRTVAAGLPLAGEHPALVHKSHGIWRACFHSGTVAWSSFGHGV